MLIKTNLPTLKKNSIPENEVEAWLAKHPEKRAESLTGKLKDEPLRFGINSYEGIMADVEAKREREAREAEESKKARARSVQWLTSHQKALMERKVEKKGPSRYVRAKSYFAKRIKAGHVVTINEMDQFSRSTLSRMVRELRGEGIGILTVTENNYSVGWVSSNILKGRK